MNKPKPRTGLWASPIDSEWGWKEWCESEDFRDCNKDNSFTFKLHPYARVFEIHDLDDLEKLPVMDHPLSAISYGLDFEEIAKNYDAIFLSDEGQAKTRMSHPSSLYGWDCECILVLNKEVIKLD